MAVEDILIPDIGDADDVEVVEVCVAVGDEVVKDAPLVVIESDKASMEVPSPSGGRITRIDVKVGDRVKQGQVIVAVDVVPQAASAPPKATDAKPKVPAATPVAPRAPEAAAKPVPAVPSIARSAGKRLEIRLPDVGEAKDVTVVEVAVARDAIVKVDDLLVVVESDKASMEVPAPTAGRVLEVAVEPGASVAEGSLLVVIESSDPAIAPIPSANAPTKARSVPPTAVASASSEGAAGQSGAIAKGNVYAGPSVRRLARELGVELAHVKGSGARERIVKEDVQSYVKARLTGGDATPAGAAGTGIPALPMIDFSKFGEVEVVVLSRIRKRGAENLRRSWLNVVHVTQHDEADVGDLEAFRNELKPEAAARGVKLTPLAFIVRALIPVLKAFPTFNASLDPSVQSLILKRFINIGFAVDTPEGLVVPVIRAADEKGVFDLAREIEVLSTKAREGKLTPAELSGGSFSVSSLGAIGGTGFTPIVNAPEVAILGVSRLVTKPHWTGSSFEPRQFLPVSLSYDHRAINGAEAGRFVTSFCSTLGDLRRALL